MEDPEPDLAAVLDFLKGLGASDEQLAAAAASESPARLALDLVLARSFVLSARQVAESVNVTVEQVVEIVAKMGFLIDDLDAPRFSEDDVELVALTHQIGHGLSHVLASSIGRIADAGVASYITEVDPRLSSMALRETTGGGLRTMFENFRIRFGYASTTMDELAIAKANATAGEVARRAAGTLGSAFIHALRGAVEWQRVAQEGTTDRSLQRIAVGFVDLVGFACVGPLPRITSSTFIAGSGEPDLPPHRSVSTLTEAEDFSAAIGSALRPNRSSSSSTERSERSERQRAERTSERRNA